MLQHICCCVVFNVPPTAKVIRRRGHGLVSSDRLVKPGIEPATPGLQGKRFIHYTTAAPHFSIFNLLYFQATDGSKRGKHTTYKLYIGDQHFPKDNTCCDCKKRGGIRQLAVAANEHHSVQDIINKAVDVLPRREKILW